MQNWKRKVINKVYENTSIKAYMTLKEYIKVQKDMEKMPGYQVSRPLIYVEVPSQHRPCRDVTVLGFEAYEAWVAYGVGVQKADPNLSS